MSKLELIAFKKLQDAVSDMGKVVYEMDRVLEYEKDAAERERRRKNAMDSFLIYSKDYRIAIEALTEK